jgi:hypothetical protein
MILSHDDRSHDSAFADGRTHMDHNTEAVWNTDTSLLDALELEVVARLMIAARRSLHTALPSELIPDPAMDLLLQLFLADVRGERLLANRLAKATFGSLPTLQRWAAALVQYGLIDRDETGFGLTADGRLKMVQTLRAVVDSQSHADAVTV